MKGLMFNKLSWFAKKQAIDNVRSSNFYLCDDWYEHVIEQIKEAGMLIGITISHCYFSGFGGSNDGFSMDATYTYRKNWRTDVVKAEKIKSLFDKMLDIGLEFQTAQAPQFYKLSAYTFSTGKHSQRTKVSHTELGDVFDSSREGVEDAINSFTHAAFIALRDEYGYLMSDEMVTEYIITNNLLFDDRGSIL